MNYLKHQEQEIKHLKGWSGGEGDDFRENGGNPAVKKQIQSGERKSGGGWGRRRRGEFIEEKTMENARKLRNKLEILVKRKKKKKSEEKGHRNLLQLNWVWWDTPNFFFFFFFSKS